MGTNSSPPPFPDRYSGALLTLLRRSLVVVQFHLECVGLDKAPEGAWYCDDCVAELNIDPATMRPKR